MKVSIVTPSYNQGAYIGDSLSSVLEQSGEDLVLEHIVVDGASTDLTLNVLQEWQTKTGNLDSALYQFSYRSEPDTGQTQAINKGLKQATGDILCYLCSDDFLESDCLKQVTELFIKYPDTDVVYGDYFFLEGESGWKRFKNAGNFSVERIRQNNFLGQPAVFWRRRVYETFGAFDENLSFCMDHEYWLRICGETKWQYLPASLATCRLHGGAKTSSSLTEAWWETAEMAGRYGLGKRFYWQAWAMQLVGKRLYRFKRWLFENLGKWLKRK